MADDSNEVMPELVVVSGPGSESTGVNGQGEGSTSVEEGTVSAPAKVMRIGSMIKQLLEERHIRKRSQSWRRMDFNP